MNISWTRWLFTEVSDLYFYNQIPMESVLSIEAFKYKANLQLVRLYIDTPTFDKITKDQSSKLEDRISTIGGNLGLLTGDNECLKRPIYVILKKDFLSSLWLRLPTWWQKSYLDLLEREY